MDVTKTCEFIRFGAMDVTKPCEFIWFGAMDVTKPYEFTGFGAMDATKSYEFIGFGAMDVTKTQTQVYPSPPASRERSVLRGAQIGTRAQHALCLRALLAPDWRPIGAYRCQ